MPRRISSAAKRALGQEGSSSPDKATKVMKLSPTSDGSESNCSSPDVVDRVSTSMMHQYSESKSTTTHSSEMIQDNIYPQQTLSSPPKPVSVAPVVASTSIVHQVDQFSTEPINTPPATISSTKRRFNKVKSESNNNTTSSHQSNTHNQPPSSPENLTLLPANIKASVLTENTSPSTPKIVDSNTITHSSDPSPIMIATSQQSLAANSSNSNTEMDETLHDSLNAPTTINTDNIQEFDFIITDPDVKMQFKKSRDYSFIPSFPKVLYTLTWKHKYDLKISSEKPIFQGVPQKLMMSLIKIELVMGRDFSTPSYDHSKVRQRDRNVNEDSRKKRPHRKPTESETTTLTSVSKENDNTIVVRFGINRTFCSKRFNYAPFRLRLDFESENYPFTLFTPIFHTFAKKLTGFTVVNVNEILKKNGEALLPVDNTDEVCTDLVGVYRPSIPVDGYQSEQGESIASSSRTTGAPSKENSAEPETTTEDANLLLSLGGLL